MLSSRCQARFVQAIFCLSRVACFDAIHMLAEMECIVQCGGSQQCGRVTHTHTHTHTHTVGCSKLQFTSVSAALLALLKDVCWKVASLLALGGSSDLRYEPAVPGREPGDPGCPHEFPLGCAARPPCTWRQVLLSCCFAFSPQNSMKPV